MAVALPSLNGDACHFETPLSLSPPPVATTIPSGSFIINMGITPQTYANGLKPYGLIYDLLKNYNVPIQWVIADGKAKDGIDFTHNGIDYKGGAFIITSEYRSAAVNARIAFWQGQGVVGATSVADFIEDVDYTLSSAPNWVLDFKNGNLAEAAFTNSGIPNTAYSEKLPSALDCCDYLYIMPHADPTWATHSRLYSWMKNKSLSPVNGEETCRGWFWGGCHAVSVIEDVTNPGNSAQRMNFLSQGVGPGTIDPVPDLLNFGNHDDGTAPYTYDYDDHPFMQFLGIFDGATENGSEQIFMPDIGAEWRPGVTIGTEDLTQTDVPGNSPGEAAKLVWGEAWGNDIPEGGSGNNNTEGSEDFTAGNGWALYSGGHTFTKGSVAQNVAIQRAFFNYSFMAAFDRGATITYTSPPPVSIVSGIPVNLGASASGTTGSFSFEWIATPNIGSFSAPNPVSGSPATITYTPPNVGVNTDIIISLIVTDGCGNTSREDNNVTITPPAPQPPVCSNVILSNPPNADLITDLTALVTDPDGNLQASGFSITAPLATHGTAALDVSATATYTPDFNNQLQDVYTYQACDDDGQCCTGTVTINTECPTDANTQIFGTVFFDGIGSAQGVIDGSDYGYGTGALVRLYEDNAPTGLPLGGEDIELTDISPASTNANGGYVFSLNNTASTTGTVMSSVATLEDDVAQHHTSPFNLHTPQDNIRINLGNDNFFGLRFTNINVPQGATITNAFITLHVDGNEGGSGSNVNIKVQDSDDAPQWPQTSPAYNSAISNIHNSSSLATTVAWPTGAVANNVDFSTTDIKTLVQAIVNRAGWNPNQAMVFTFETTSTAGEIKFEAFENSNNNPAKLTVEYTIPGTPATGDYIVVLDAPSVSPLVPTPVGTPTQHKTMFKGCLWQIFPYPNAQ